jgi:hypothetical protein
MCWMFIERSVRIQERGEKRDFKGSQNIVVFPCRPYTSSIEFGREWPLNPAPLGLVHSCGRLDARPVPTVISKKPRRVYTGV